MIYVGKDDHYLLMNHCKEMFDEIDNLEQGLVKIVDASETTVIGSIVYYRDLVIIARCIRATYTLIHDKRLWQTL